jgi:hypothetical protein
MRIFDLLLAILLLAFAAAACTTKPIEGVCCVDAADCARLGLDEPRPCGVGQACQAFECVAAECASSAECTAPGAPVCVAGLCVAACRADDDCAGAAGGPRCAADGACVGCLADAECPATAQFCDAEDRRCRGCEIDAECASGVCIEADGACAAPDQIVYVRDTGADAGDCTGDAPCKTLSFALGKVTGGRNVIRVIGGSLVLPASTIAIDRSVVIDASDTRIIKPSSGPLFAVGASLGQVTLEGVSLLGSGSSGDPTITVAAGSALRIVRSWLSTSLVEVTNGALDLRDSKVTASLTTMDAVVCRNGTVSARRVAFEHTAINTMNCQLTVSRCRFDEIDGGSVVAQGGVVAIENNLLITTLEVADLMSILGLAPGSVVRFNTFINTSGVDAAGVALACDGNAAVTSNIFAYGSSHPLGPAGTPPCPARFSVFDSVAVAQQTMGQGNQTADGATLFVDHAARDFHLSAASPARGVAEPGQSLAEDFDGRPRPAPVGTRADAGCFEAP